ncbi:hypothetical protein L210DRAFT_3542330 [Boletus edulis BED1]|uniref:Uncharacterized protein n=1 Tax=Boletus edulis BED1 TaxID=1328754 RepID=A0AAD4BSX8_BOLED|nr:hypothetical protein L210DRAFT_3542330 [Boletus edulis BED1]
MRGPSQALPHIATLLAMSLPSSPPRHPGRIAPLLFGTMLTPHPAPCASLAYKVSLSTLVLHLNQELRVDPVALPPVHVCRSVAAHCLYKTILFRKISD